MKLRELKYNVFFEYIKDIRRYNYDIEIFLKSENLCDIVNPTIPLPDEVEPLADRLNIVKDFENTTCIFAVSQMSLTTIIQYKNDIFEENKTKIELEQLKKYTDKLVDFLNSKISNFKIIFEGISVASSMMTKPDNIENIQKLLPEIILLDDLTDEYRLRVSKELDERYIFIEEKTIMKTYSLDINAINPFLVKNKKDNFIGWNIISFKELNNRLYYNYNEIINNHNRLESSDISNLLGKKDS
jgi:hypothetical protein